jgi:Na+/pantothenate symporter
MARDLFGLIDYLVFIAVLAITVMIGLYHGFRRTLKKRVMSRIFNQPVEEDSNQSKVGEYFVANSSMNSLPIAFSLLASFFSTTTMLGVPAEF